MKVGDEYFYYQTDHLGTPQKLTACNGEVVWSAKYNSFGKATIEVETVENNLRFPGQYEDGETGLHYNYHRYYDPVLGRYLRNDPIGFNGGINLYIYTLNNPIQTLDPLGLNSNIVFPPMIERDIQQLIDEINSKLKKKINEIDKSLEKTACKVRCGSKKAIELIRCDYRWHKKEQTCSQNNIWYAAKCHKDAKSEGIRCRKNLHIKYSACIKDCECM